jgi:hypothetical protein
MKSQLDILDQEIAEAQLTHDNVFFLNRMTRSILLDDGLDVGLEPFLRCREVFYELIHRRLCTDICRLVACSKGERMTPRNVFPNRPNDHHKLSKNTRAVHSRMRPIIRRSESQQPRNESSPSLRHRELRVELLPRSNKPVPAERRNIHGFTSSSFLRMHGIKEGDELSCWLREISHRTQFDVRRRPKG